MVGKDEELKRPATEATTFAQSPWLICGLALALSASNLLLYLPTRQFDFLNWDDLTYVAQNDYVRGGLSWAGISWAFTHFYAANWHPVTWISHMMDCQVYGAWAGGHHQTNAFLHSINAALLFLLLRAATAATWRSALVAAIFALHPLRVESVAWISERKDLLSACFFLLALWAYTSFVKSHRTAAMERQPHAGSGLSRQQVESRWRCQSLSWYCLALGLFAFGLMSKPMVVTLPFVLLLLDFWPFRRIDLIDWRQSVAALSLLAREKWPFFVLSAASCFVTMVAQSRGGAVAPFAVLPWETRIGHAVVAYVEYLAKLLWPVNLCAVYPLPIHQQALLVAGCGLLLVTVTAVAWRWRRHSPFLLMGWCWFLGTLVPVIGLVQVGNQALADRYTYLPTLGIIISVVWLGSQLGGKWRWFPAASTVASVIAILVCGVIAGRQLTSWRNTETLFRRVLALSPDSVQALNGLGAYLVEHGRIEEGKDRLLRATQLQPNYAEPLATLGNAFDSENRFDEAVKFYQRALEAEANLAGVWNNLAWLRASCPNPAFRDGPEAVRCASHACELTGYRKPLFIGTLAAAQAESGDFQAAIGSAERAVSLARGLHLEDVATRNLELAVLYRQGKAAHGGPPSAREPIP